MTFKWAGFGVWSLSSLFFLSGCTSLFPKSMSQSSSLSQMSPSDILFGSSSPKENTVSSVQNDNAWKSAASRLGGKSTSSKQDMITQAQMASLNLVHVEGNTWRTAVNPNLVYGMMARLLSQTYIIASADKNNMTLQTDWDKFFIDGKLFRNRISIMVFAVGSKQTEVSIKNTMEYYAGNLGEGQESYAWLPSPDLTNEVQKLVENTNRQTAYAFSQYLMN